MLNYLVPKAEILAEIQMQYARCN